MVILYLMIPPEPDVPEGQRGVGSAPVRYEDVSEDGRIRLTSLSHFLGLALWQNAVANNGPSRTAARQGIVPVLTRLAFEGGSGPHSVRRPVEGRGCFQLAHTVDDAGGPDRILLNMWLTMTAPAGRTYGPPPPNRGEPIVAGRVFGEHVFTRLFAPKAERKVLALPGLEGPPPARYTWRAAEDLVALPPAATPLDDDLIADDAPIVFGLTHSDSNHHVNSLVYPILFEDAALRRFHALGLTTRVLAHSLEIAYRKPCFAGEAYRIHLRAFREDGALAAAGTFVPAGGGRPHCHIVMRFS
ncbi:MAG TPA: hypothetical protein VKE22_29360 [Haliangiales bacterium]|nr:hypothetical protein [Haliangiales bacterium]